MTKSERATIEEVLTLLQKAKPQGSRDLDYRIAKIVGWKEHTVLSDTFSQSQHYWVGPEDGGYISDPPNYTSSIDAALTLFKRMRRGLNLYRLTQPDMGGKEYAVSYQGPFIRVASRSWPLALCIAYLTEELSEK